MRHATAIVVLSFVALGLVAGGAWAKNSPGRYASYRFTETPTGPTSAREIGGSMFQAAAATTVTLGWWQFDAAGGTPTKQGWTEVDITTQLKKYWHVDGEGVEPCHGITSIGGSKSMWCGQWNTATSPWCGWGSLPGYGNHWDQSLESTVTDSRISYTIWWDSEPGYDFTYVEWRDPTNGMWVADGAANHGVGYFDGAGGFRETLESPFGATRVRFHMTSDGSRSDEDDLRMSLNGAAMVDDLAFGGSVEDWEGEVCQALQSTDGKWVATIPAGFGLYSKLVSAAQVVQEDPLTKPLSNLWAWFDNPAETNFACGGWPLQGALAYGPNDNGSYLMNEVWSPWVPITGNGNVYLLEFLVYRDLPLDNLQFYVWHIRTRNSAGCPGYWKDSGFVYYGGGKDWFRERVNVGALVGSGATEVQVAVGAWDMCGVWCGIHGTGACHSHAPLIDQVKLVHVNVPGPQWIVNPGHLWQDNFPELGGIGSTSYARCDMAADILPVKSRAILPGDSLVVTVTDPVGLAEDNTGGRPGKAVYVLVLVKDRNFGDVPGKTGTAIQSPDNKAYEGDPRTGSLRWPWVESLTNEFGLDVFRMDYVYTPNGGRVRDQFCVDLMDLAAGPDGPPYHPNETYAANTGIFSPGDIVWYFFAAKNSSGVWSSWTRGPYDPDDDGPTSNRHGIGVNTCEWSVLPDAGRQPGDLGDILLVDDADGSGGEVQPELCFDMAFLYMNMLDRVDCFDVLAPSSAVGNSLASRVKNIQAQVIGDPVEIYQIVLWNSDCLSNGLMGDGGTPNGGSGLEKSDDFGLCYQFLNTHPNNPGWAYWGDDVVQDWATLVGLGADNVKRVFMNHTLVADDQKTVSGVVSPKVFPASPDPPATYLQPTESFYANGGRAIINDFDVPGQSGLSRVSHRYANATTGQTAALSQITLNGAWTNARFYLAGFAYNFIRDDDTNGVPDYVKHLQEILVWFQNPIGQPTGIDPVAYANRLDDAYPNPFNPTTTIKYSIASAGHVTLRIYNAAGQLVRTLVDADQAPQAGDFSVTWDGAANTGESVASGVYFYQLTAKDFLQTKKMVFLK